MRRGYRRAPCRLDFAACCGGGWCGSAGIRRRRYPSIRWRGLGGDRWRLDRAEKTTRPDPGGPATDEGVGPTKSKSTRARMPALLFVAEDLERIYASGAPSGNYACHQGDRG